MLEPDLAPQAAAADQYDVLRCLTQSTWVFELRSHLAYGDSETNYKLAARLTPVFMQVDELNGFKTRSRVSLAESRTRMRENRPDYEDPRGKDEERRLRRDLRRKLDGELWMSLRDFVLWQVMFGSAWFPEMDTLLPTLRLPADLPDGDVRRRLEEVEEMRRRRRGR